MSARLVPVAALAAVLSLMAAGAAGQQMIPAPRAPGPSPTAPAAPAAPAAPGTPTAPAAPAAPANGRTPGASPQIDFGAMRSEFDRRTPAAAVGGGASDAWTADYARRGWEWHLFSTKVLFWLVIVIVAFGLYITYVQFRRDYSEWHAAPRPPGAAGSEPEAPAPPAPAPASPTSVKIGPGGLEITSQVVGLLVLSLSLAFFYLYIRDVYPIHLVGPADSAQDAGPAGQHPDPAR